MPVKEIKCRCKTNTEVELEPAKGYVKITPFMCDCGRTYLIRDYVNAMTSYGEVELKEYDEMLQSQMKDKKRDKIMNPTDDGRDMYQAVEKWLNKLSNEAIAGIEHQRTFLQMIDKGYVIETILEHCKYEDDLLEKLYKQSQGTIDFNASNNSPQCFTDKKDWYIINIQDGKDGQLSRPYDSEDEVKTVIDKLVDDKENYDVAYTYISVTKGATVTI